MLKPLAKHNRNRNILGKTEPEALLGVRIVLVVSKQTGKLLSNIIFKNDWKFSAQDIVDNFK